MSVLKKIIPWAILALILIALFYGLRGCDHRGGHQDSEHGSDHSSEHGSEHGEQDEGGLSSMLDKAGDAVSNAAGATTGAITDAASAAKEGLENAADATGEALSSAADTVSETASNAVDATGEALNDAAAATKEGLADAADATGDALNSAADTLTQTASDAATSAKDGVEGAVDGASDALKSAGDAAAKTASDASEGASSVLSGAYTYAKTSLKDAGNAILDLFRVKLPNGESIEIPKGGAEEKLIDAIKNGKTGEAYIVDRLNFASGSDRLTQASEDQINALAMILKAYPEERVLLRGHTDSTGDAQFNNLLSKSRAQNVEQALIASGVAANRIDTAGLGSAEPIATNATAEGRLANRRIDIQLVK